MGVGLLLAASIMLMVAACLAALLSVDFAWARRNGAALTAMGVTMACTAVSGLLLGWTLAGGAA